MMKDKYWDEIIPQEMMYTVLSIGDKKAEFQGSAEVTLR